MKAEIINEDSAFASFDLVLRIESKDELTTLLELFGMFGSTCKYLSLSTDACNPFNNANIYELLRSKL